MIKFISTFTILCAIFALLYSFFIQNLGVSNFKLKTYFTYLIDFSLYWIGTCCIYTEVWGKSLETENQTKAYSENQIEANRIEMEKAKQKYEQIKQDIDKIRESNIGDIFWTSYNKYVEFLDTLTADKIVCVFNIIIGAMTLSSFFTVLSIMLSENILNRISFLDKYPRILKILRFRNNINRKISKFYLLTHVIVIL